MNLVFMVLLSQLQVWVLRVCFYMHFVGNCKVSNCASDDKLNTGFTTWRGSKEVWEITKIESKCAHVHIFTFSLGTRYVSTHHLTKGTLYLTHESKDINVYLRKIFYLSLTCFCLFAYFWSWVNFLHFWPILVLPNLLFCSFYIRRNSVSKTSTIQKPKFIFLRKPSNNKF